MPPKYTSPKYTSPEKEQITKRVYSDNFSKKKGTLHSYFDFDSDMIKRQITWLLVDTEAKDLFKVCKLAYNQSKKFTSTNKVFEEIKKWGLTHKEYDLHDGCIISVTISKTCRHKNCKIRDDYLYYYEIVIQPSSCSIELTEPDFELFKDKLESIIKQNKEKKNEMLTLKGNFEPQSIHFRFGTRELKDLVDTLTSFKPSHDCLAEEQKTAFVRGSCPNCSKNNKQKFQFGVHQIFDEGTEEETFGVSNTIAEFYEDEYLELIYAFKTKLNEHKEILYGKIARKWK